VPKLASAIKPEQWLTTGQLAALTSIPQQTLITWDRNGILKATARPGVRSSPRAARRYDENGLTAALFARAISLMGFTGKREFAEMVQRVQSADEKALKKAALYTYRSFPGLMKHTFSSDLTRADDRESIAFLRGRDGLVEEPTSLWTIREALHEYACLLMTSPVAREMPLRRKKRK
jgi:DNA-binding transcriptional MerR regulator